MIEANIHSTGAYASALAAKAISQQDSVGVFVPLVDAIRYNTATHRFEKWNGTGWVPEIVAGTGESVGLTEHLDDTSNPHVVTAAQVGAPTLATLTAHTGASNNPHAVTAAQVGAPTSAALTAHTDRSDNPHAVTAAQVGAPTSAALTAHTGDTNNPHLITAAQIGASSSGELTTHTGARDNPHFVTAAQVGAPTAASLLTHTGNTSNPHAVTAAQIGAVSGMDKRPAVYASPGGSNDGTGRDTDNRMNAESLAAYLLSGGKQQVYLLTGEYITSQWVIPNSTTVAFILEHGTATFRSTGGPTELQGVISFHTGFDVVFIGNVNIRNAYLTHADVITAGGWTASTIWFDNQAPIGEPFGTVEIENSHIRAGKVMFEQVNAYGSQIMCGHIQLQGQANFSGTQILVTAGWSNGEFNYVNSSTSCNLFDGSVLSTSYLRGEMLDFNIHGGSLVYVHSHISKLDASVIAVVRGGQFYSIAGSVTWNISDSITVTGGSHLQISGSSNTISAPNVYVIDRSYMAGPTGFTVNGQVHVHSGSWFGSPAGNYTSVAPSVESGSHSWTNHGLVRP